MMNFAFYDFETTGTSPKYDQALPFAAILTDEKLKPIEEIDIRCRLSDHILPSPIAMAITGVTPRDLVDQSLTLFEFSGELATLIESWRPAVWTGYNSISFDENVFRQLFYQNLHPNPYLTQTSGNTRLDVLRVVYACWGFRKTVLKIPTLGSGKRTTKLDTLAPFNGFSEHNAHDALGDVKATIFIAKLIREQIPEIWNVIVGNLDKHSMLSALKAGTIFDLVERYRGGDPRIYTGVYCGSSNTNKNQFGFFDLNAADANDYLEGDEDLFATAVNKSPKIIRTVDLNKMPLLFPVNNPDNELQRTAQRIRQSTAVSKATGKALAARFVDRKVPEQVEDQIYIGFYSPSDQQLLQRFQIAEWRDRGEIVASLSDSRLQVLGNRLMAIYAPEFTSNEIVNNFWQLISDRWSGKESYGENEKEPGNTYSSVSRDLNELMPGRKFEVDTETLVDIANFFDERKLAK